MIINYTKVGIAAALVAAASYVIYTQREFGAQKEREANLQRNSNAISNADSFSASLNECLALGGMFTFETGKCSGVNSNYWSFSSWFHGKDEKGSRQD